MIRQKKQITTTIRHIHQALLAHTYSTRKQDTGIPKKYITHAFKKKEKKKSLVNFCYLLVCTMQVSDWNKTGVHYRGN